MRPHLDKPTKVIIGGILAGALVYALGELNTHRLKERVRELQKACVAENEAGERKQGALSALAGLFMAKATCDPAELVRGDGYAGIQEHLATTEREVQHWDKWSSIAAIGIAVMSCLPWLWYFFLRRIRELREAIIGK